MRTIKLFEDFNTPQDFIKELKDFCEMYLAYLIDEGFEVNVINMMHDDDLVLSIEKISSFTNYTDGPHGTRIIDNSFKWSEVSDHFIPFFQMLSKEYYLVKNRYTFGTINLREEMTVGRRTGWTWKNYDNIEGLDPDKKIDKIQITIKVE
jgi:hypothetical protein